MGTPGRTFKMIRTAIILLLVSILVQNTLLDDNDDVGKQAEEAVKKIGNDIENAGEKVLATAQDGMSKINEKVNEMASSSGERGMSLYCGVLLLLVIFFK